MKRTPSFAAAVHYFYFALSVLCLTAGIIFLGDFALFSCELIAFSLIYSGVSVSAAYFIQRSGDSAPGKGCVLRYILLASLSFAFTLAVIFTSPYVEIAAQGFLFAGNYFIFILLIWLPLARIPAVRETISRLSISMEGAKKLAGEHSAMFRAGGYAIGSDPAIDALLRDIWLHRDEPLPYVRGLEAAFCRKLIRESEARLKRLEAEPAPTPDQKRLASMTRGRLAGYRERLRQLQRQG
ncbi:MAG: hypothetical protein FJY76_03755 [Candidatus Aenigmarchaeota archaeon]|nr:hypothetical protein [Candidatus Aenigmarchaeota archaeon]